MKTPTPEEIAAVSPALEQHLRETLTGEVWKRAGLSVRDRAIITVSVLIARNQAAAMPYFFGFALENDVTVSELSEIITHLAFYSGWGNALQAVAVAKDLFEKRGILANQLPPAVGERLPLNEKAEAQRAAMVEQTFGSVSPGVVEYTATVLFRDLWLRPALAPRDRSLVTVSALVSAGQSAQIPYHLNRAADHGLSREQGAEVLTHLAFYAGWPNVFSAMPVFQDVFEKRSGRQ